MYAAIEIDRFAHPSVSTAGLSDDSAIRPAKKSSHQDRTRTPREVREHRSAERSPCISVAIDLKGVHLTAVADERHGHDRHGGSRVAGDPDPAGVAGTG